MLDVVFERNITWDECDLLNKGGFVLRDRGTLRGELPYGLLPDAEKTIGTGSFGAAVLHDQSATAGNAPTHTSGKHEGFRKSAGYSFMGGQSYNLLTESNDSITSPYPFTFEDAVESEKTLIDDLNAAQDEVEKLEKSKVGKSEKQIKTIDKTIKKITEEHVLRRQALAELQQDLNSIGQPAQKKLEKVNSTKICFCSSNGRRRKY